MSQTQAIKILIVDDHPLMRSALRTFFQKNDAFDFVGEAAGAGEALDLAAHLHPDVVLTDINMQPVNGIELTRQLTGLYPGITVIGFSNTFLSGEVTAMKVAGAVAVIPKLAPLQQLREDILALRTRALAQ